MTLKTMWLRSFTLKGHSLYIEVRNKIEPYEDKS